LRAKEESDLANGGSKNGQKRGAKRTPGKSFRKGNSKTLGKKKKKHIGGEDGGLGDGDAGKAEPWGKAGEKKG